jgi:hypothetical protein
VNDHNILVIQPRRHTKRKDTTPDTVGWSIITFEWCILWSSLRIAKNNLKGYALHWNLTTDHGSALPDEPSTGAPNPEMWELKYKSGKGFILVDDETETVREV